MNEESETVSKGIVQGAGLALKSALLLIAAGLLLVASGKMRGKIDLSGMRKRLPRGKRLVSRSKEEPGPVQDLD